MKLATLLETPDTIKITHYDADEDQTENDGQTYQACENLTKAEIYISRDSQLLYIATHNNTPIGCIWGKVTSSDDEDYKNVFSVDIVVKNTHRHLMVGPKLIKAAINEYNDLKDQYDGDLFMGCEVVNQKLADYLQRRHNFQHMDRHGNWGQGEWSTHSPHLVYDGTPLTSRPNKKTPKDDEQQENPDLIYSPWHKPQ